MTVSSHGGVVESAVESLRARDTAAYFPATGREAAENRPVSARGRGEEHSDAECRTAIRRLGRQPA
jgi:hypothetical protein